VTCPLVLVLLAGAAEAHRPADPPHQLYQIGDLTLESGQVIYQTWAYETHDVGTTPGMNGDYAKALRAIKAKTLIMTGVKDLLNPEWEPLEAARYMRDVRTVTINPDSVTGHYAAGGFLPADVKQINVEVEHFSTS
jgi:homoserine acetyltransferase